MCLLPKSPTNEQMCIFVEAEQKHDTFVCFYKLVSNTNMKSFIDRLQNAPAVNQREILQCAENLNGSNINTSTMLDPVLPHRVTKTHPLPALQQLHLLHLPPQPLYTWREKKGSKSSNLQRIHEVSSNKNMFAFHSVLLDTTVPLPFQKEQLGNILAPNTLCLSS